MLTHLDEVLFHQIATTFDHAGTSDHRFYDRYYLEAADEAGSAAIAAGLAVYKNTNVVDGFVTVLHGDTQHNVRLSRSLRDDMGRVQAGPLSIEVVEPMKTLRLAVSEGDHGLAADVVWEATLPPVEEVEHFTRVDGRVSEQVHRYNQVGRAQGVIDVGGKRIDVDDWWAARDHSWGVRPGVGGYEPKTGSLPAAVVNGFLYTWFTFSTKDVAGYLQVHETGAGRRVVFDGVLRAFRGGEWQDLAVEAVEYEFSFPDGSRNYERARVMVTTSPGEKWEITCSRLMQPYVMRGTGYDSGYRDGRGLGFYRGDSLVEWDTYDLTEPGSVRILPGGEELPHFHREQLVHVEVNGAPGTGHFTVLPVGALPAYGVPAFSAAELATLARMTGREQ